MNESTECGDFERLGEIYGWEHWGNVIKWESWIRGGRDWMVSFCKDECVDEG